MGILEALYRTMNGENMFGGMMRRTVCDVAVICATPASTRAFGWKNTLITDTPGSDCDSMCSISLTVVVKARSAIVEIRFSISSGEIPV